MACGVQVKTGAAAKIVTVVLAGQVQTTGAGVRAHNGNAQLRRFFLGPGLLHEILVGTGQPRQPVKNRHFLRVAAHGNRRKVHGKLHIAVQGCRVVLVAPVFAVETDVGGEQLHGYLSVGKFTAF